MTKYIAVYFLYIKHKKQNKYIYWQSGDSQSIKEKRIFIHLSHAHHLNFSRIFVLLIVHNVDCICVSVIWFVILNGRYAALQLHGKHSVVGAVYEWIRENYTRKVIWLLVIISTCLISYVNGGNFPKHLCYHTIVGLKWKIIKINCYF